MRAPSEFKILYLHEAVVPSKLIETPDQASQYWHANIPSASWFDPCKEALVVLVLNTRRHILGHNLVALGSLDTIIVHPREVFRPAIAMAGHAIILTHNHPSGDSTPSEADIKATRDLIRAGQLLRIEVLDHIVIGQKTTSLRECGHFY